MNNSGYCVITVNGETIGLKFGMLAIEQIQKNCKNLDADSTIQMTSLGLPHILLAGYENNCQRKGVPAVHDFTFFYDAVEDALSSTETFAQFDAVIKCFTESKWMPPIVNPDEQKKKNQAGRKLKVSAMES